MPSQATGCRGRSGWHAHRRSERILHPAMHDAAQKLCSGSAGSAPYEETSSVPTQPRQPSTTRRPDPRPAGSAAATRPPRTRSCPSRSPTRPGGPFASRTTTTRTRNNDEDEDEEADADEDDDDDAAAFVDCDCSPRAIPVRQSCVVIPSCQ